jgi:hypothetical protein
MTKNPSTHITPRRSAAMIATVAAALLATTQFAEAKKKPDPAVLLAVSNAQTQDIEEAVKIGIGVGDQIAIGAIKLSTTNVNALVAGLADAIIAKVPNPSDPIDPNRIDNKQDELGEVAAYVFHAVAQSVKIKSTAKGLGQAKKYALATMKSALKAAVKNSSFVTTSVINDVVASVAQTIHNDPKFDLYEAKLQKALTKASKSIAGKANKTTVAAALTAGFGGDPDAGTKYEDGTLPLFAQVSDPETDFRNA